MKRYTKYSGKGRRYRHPERATGHQIIGFAGRPHDDIDSWTTRPRPTLRPRISASLAARVDNGKVVKAAALAADRNCKRCGSPLSRYNLDDTCGPCAVAIRDIEDTYGSEIDDDPTEG